MLAWLRPFCGDDAKPVRPRIEVLQILEHSFNLSDQDIHLLVFFRSQAILKACWPNRKVKNMHKPTLAQNTIYTSHINIITFPHLWLSISLFPLWGTVNVISFYSATLCELACAYRNCLTILTHVVVCVGRSEMYLVQGLPIACLAMLFGLTSCCFGDASMPFCLFMWCFMSGSMYQSSWVNSKVEYKELWNPSVRQVCRCFLSRMTFWFSWLNV